MKIDIRTAGRDPCLAEGFIMKTLVPNDEAMNDVFPKDNAKDDDSVDTEIGRPIPIDDVPPLPENMDEELVQSTLEDDPKDFLQLNRGRRKKKDTFQGSHRHDRNPTPERR